MYGNLILEKFKLNSDDEVIRLGGVRLLSCSGTEYTHFFGNIYMFEVNFQHHRKESVKGQGDVHSFKLTVKSGGEVKESIISHEALNLTGESGLIDTVKRLCMEISKERLDHALGGK
ncbi:hypothetical protein vBAbaPP1_84 [Acinetobacter phage vB_AbaM_P1]|nr:hypothetical protein vBAbaPP1_84 [Acinetobacter phage vB_AbaM_P1]